MKVTFDGYEKIIHVVDGYTELDFDEDIYSEWKRWVLTAHNDGYYQALRVVGGDPITGTQNLGSTFFLMNGWVIQSWEGDHELVIDGNFYHDDGIAPVIPVDGPYTVLVTRKVSNLIDQIITETGGLTEEQADQLEATWKRSSLIIPIFSNTS